MELNLTEADLNLLKEKGISEATLEKQLADFRNGFPYLRIVRPASTDDESILTIDEETARKISRRRRRSTQIRTCLRRGIAHVQGAVRIRKLHRGHPGTR